MLVDIPAAQHKKIFFIVSPGILSVVIRNMRQNIYCGVWEKAASEGQHRIGFNDWYFSAAY